MNSRAQLVVGVRQFAGGVRQFAGGMWQIALAGIVVWLFIVHGMGYLNYGVMTTLESSFPHAVGLAMQGEVPYRDFAFIEMPLALYVKGLFTLFFDTGIVFHRGLNLAITFVALVGLVVVFKLKFSAWEPGLAAAFAVVCSPHWMSAMVQGTTGPVALFFLVLTFGSVVLTGRDRIREILFSVGGAAAVSASLHTIPWVMGLWVAFLSVIPGWKQRLRLTVIFVCLLAIFLGGWWLLAGDTFIFFNWTFNRSSEMSRHVILLLSETWKVSPGAILGCLCGWMASWVLLKRRLWGEQWLLLVSVVSVFVVLLPNNAYGKDIAPIVPFVAASGIIAVWRLGMGTGSPFRYVFWIFPLISLLYPFPDRLAEKTSIEIEETAQVIRQMAPDGPVLTPLPIIAQAASRPLYPDVDLGMLSVLSPKYSRYEDKLHMTTLKSLTSGVEQQLPAAIVLVTGSTRSNFGWGTPDMQPQPGALIRNFNWSAGQNYIKVHQTQSLQTFIRK